MLGSLSWKEGIITGRADPGTFLVQVNILLLKTLYVNLYQQSWALTCICWKCIYCLSPWEMINSKIENHLQMKAVSVSSCFTACFLFIHQIPMWESTILWTNFKPRSLASQRSQAYQELSHWARASPTLECPRSHIERFFGIKANSQREGAHVCQPIQGIPNKCLHQLT